MVGGYMYLAIWLRFTEVSACFSMEQCTVLSSTLQLFEQGLLVCDDNTHTHKHPSHCKQWALSLQRLSPALIGSDVRLHIFCESLLFWPEKYRLSNKEAKFVPWSDRLVPSFIPIWKWPVTSLSHLHLHLHWIQLSCQLTFVTLTVSLTSIHAARIAAPKVQFLPTQEYSQVAQSLKNANLSLFFSGAVHWVFSSIGLIFSSSC